MMYFYSRDNGIYKIISCASNAYFGTHIVGEWNRLDPSAPPTDFRIVFRIKGCNVSLFKTIDGSLEQKDHPMLNLIKEKYVDSLKILSRGK